MSGEHRSDSCSLKDNHEIEKYVVKSGIRELLLAKGKKYFALSPRRQDDGSIKFWLNPMEQNKNNSCWCTLEDLREWADDRRHRNLPLAQAIDRHERHSGKKATTTVQ